MSRSSFASTLSAKLADLALGLDARRMTQSSRIAAHRMMIDTLAVSAAALDAPGMDGLRAQCREWAAAGDCRLIGTAARLSPPDAAMVNAALAHALDYDDVYMPGALHVMSSTLAASLAAAQISRATGRSLVDAVIAGVEVSCRLVLSLKDCEDVDDRSRRGFLESSVIAVFGATAAAGRLMGLNRDQLVHAMGLAYAQASGNRQALHDASLTKRLQPAFAARAAVFAAGLARHGMTGPHRALEGEAGLFQLYYHATPPDPDAFAPDGDVLQIERLSIKRYPCCGGMHPLMHTAVSLHDQLKLKVDDIERVEMYLGPHGNWLIGNPFEMGLTPQVNAQFSLAYGVAVALSRGRAGLVEFSDEQIRRDTQTAELAYRSELVTTIDPEPEYSDVPPEWNVFYRRHQPLRLLLRDGSVIRRDAQPAEVWTAAEPDVVDDADYMRKWRECLQWSGFEEDRAVALRDAITALDADGSIEKPFDVLMRQDEKTVSA